MTMKIIFDLRRTGLGNNGGSMTLIRSGNALVDLGHNVTFIDSGRNQHTWTPLKSKHIICNSDENIPDSDFIIATGYKSVIPTVQAPKRCGVKIHWLRGWETWIMPENRIIETILKAPTIKLVNSICLQRKLKRYGVESTIIRPGYDLDELYPMNVRNDRKIIILGGLYSKGKHWNIKRTQWIFDAYNILKNKYDVKLWMFGNSSMSHKVDKYIQNPSINQKKYFYNNINIWLAPAMQEGLHMPPAEAMMTGCPVVGTEADMSGIEDYLVHGRTGFIAENNFESFLENIERLINDEPLRIYMGEWSREMIEHLGTRQFNMSKLIKYFMRIINDI